MFLYNRLKKIILISCMLTLIPTPAHAWGLDAAWNSVKTTMGSLLSSATLTSITKIIKENPAAVCFTTAALAFCGYQYWKRSNAQKSPASKPFKRPSLRKDTAPMPPAPQLAPATASPMHTMSMPALALTPGRRAQAQKQPQRYQKPTKQLDSILVQPALGVAKQSPSAQQSLSHNHLRMLRWRDSSTAAQPQRTISGVATSQAKSKAEVPAFIRTQLAPIAEEPQTIAGFVDGLEKELKKITQDRQKKSAEQLENELLNLGIQAFNLKLRCGDIKGKFKERFNIPNIYKVLRLSPRASLADIQKVITKEPFNKRKDIESIRKLFSCTLAKENYDAFLTGPGAIQALAIIDGTLVGKIESLFDRIEKLREQTKKQASDAPATHPVV